MNEKKNELNTEKKRNGKIITENENIDEIHNLKQFPKMKKLETENNSNNIFETEKTEEKKIKINEKIKSKILIIEVISSIIPIGEILKISPTGLENGKRNAKDGITFFGYEEDNEDNVKLFIYNFINSLKWIISFPQKKKLLMEDFMENIFKFDLIAMI